MGRFLVVLVTVALGAAVPAQQGRRDLPSLGPVCGGQCGKERWTVKTLSDADRGHVDLRPVATSVESLATLPAEPGGENYRGRGAERHVFAVDAYLGGWRLEHDHDYHVVLFGLRNQRLSLIAEIPDPACSGACRSGFAQAYAQARSALERCLERPNQVDRALRVHVEGVGFFDTNHRQIGRAPNMIELHPVLKLTCQAR